MEIKNINSSRIFIIFQAALLFILSLNFLNGIVFGIVFYVILKPLYQKLFRYIKNKTISAIIIIIFSFFLLVIPFFYAGYIIFLRLIHEIQNQNFSSFYNLIPFNTEQFKIQEFLQSHAATLLNYLETLSFSAIGSTTAITLNIFIIYFILFFLFLRGEKVYKFLIDVIPFEKKNSKKLLQKQKTLIQSIVISNLAVAVCLGILLGTGFLIAGLNDFIFWTMISIILSIIPVIGIQFIWVPVGIYFILQQNYVTGIGIFLWGTFLSYGVDTYIRQFTQNWFGKIDPFISISGIIIGIYYFGLAGIIVGPFLISLFIESLKIYKEE